jgi:pimeloyl-ACP methyl ester carboxylesterase
MSHLSLNLRTAPTSRAAAKDGRPAEGRNNAWHRHVNTDRVIVFVHGFSDNSRDCWFNQHADAYWPDRVANTPEFAGYSIFLGGYDTSKHRSGDYGIADCADTLFRGLRLAIDRTRPVLEHRVIVFVCHSMGGIVTRYMLDFHQHAFREHTIGLALIASPSTGSSWADAVAYIADFIGNDQLKTLATESQLLRDLDRRFKALVHGNPEKVIPSMFGREACETDGYHILVPTIVHSESAGRYYGPVARLENTNHSTCVKPDSDNHQAHLFLREFMVDFEQTFTGVLHPRPTASLVCGRSRRSVLIENDDGDALHENSFLRIVAAPRGEHKLLPVRLWSGYHSAPELVQDAEATSSMVTLEHDESGSRLTFAELPEPDTPANATYRYWSASAFSMDKRELKLKTGKTDGEEFIATRIFDVQCDELIVHAQLPECMQIVGVPYAKVVHVTDTLKGELKNDAETSRTKSFLDYSPMLRTISWIVKQPLVGHSYRVCWRLAELPERPSQLSAEEQLRHVAFVTRLLWLRDCLRRNSRSREEQSAVDAFQAAVGECEALVREKVGPHLRWDVADLSLMVVDDSNQDTAAKLHTIGGINAITEDRPLAVGEGNAGRAVKRHATRIYDYEKSIDAARYGYRPTPGRQNHCWLVSVPLVADRAIFCVFNVGTFEELQVPLFRRVEPELPAIGASVHGVVERLLDRLGG